MGHFSTLFRRDVLSWGLYDFANTMYSMNILSLYFSAWLIIDLGYQDIHYSIAYSSSMLLGAILMPALGYYSDAPGGGQRKLAYLFFFTGMTIACVLGFSILPAGYLFTILILFGLSNFFYEGGIVFYNALLDSVSTPDNVGTVSGFGVALGYVGSIVGMIVVLPFVTGEVFGFDVPFLGGAGKSGAFLPTAIFFALFAIPIFLFVRERPRPPQGPTDNKRTLGRAYRDVWRSLKATEKYPGLLRFLVSDFFFEDAIATVIIFMGVFTETVLGMDAGEKTIFLILSTVFAVIGSFPLGWLADKLSPKRVLFGIVLGWIAILMVFAFNTIDIITWISGPIVGILLGGVWAVSRPLLMQLSPPEKLGEFFGLYTLSGRSAAIVGPMIWGIVVYLFWPTRAVGSAVVDVLNLGMVDARLLPYRMAIISLAIMMAFGLFLFRKVPDLKRQRIHHR